MERITNVKSVIKAGLQLFLTSDSSSSMTADIVLASASGFAISMPMKKDVFVPLAIGAQIEGYFYMGSGQYYLSTTVKNRVLLHERPVLVLEYPAEMMRAERRGYYRIDTLFPIKVIISELVGEGDQIHLESTEYNANCINISGGGLMLDGISSADIPIKESQEIEVDFCEAVPGLRRVRAIGARVPQDLNTGWGLQFAKITDSDRDKVIRYVFKKQLNDKAVTAGS
ncbi:MAG: flagellar brake protein [Deferribacteraceae bacterium]|jgi:c-di-GMP-binding flagellar brake protein YcgR|nr:flagellar brake protein [Deferribacteraceae bacterium]